MGVDDVVALSVGRQASRRAEVGAGTAGVKREHLELDLAGAAQRLTWSATKLPNAGRAGLGYMLVTISARIGAAERIRADRAAAGGSGTMDSNVHAG